MKPKLRMLMQQPSREFGARRSTVAKLAATLIMFGAAVLFVVFWPPWMAARFDRVPMAFASMGVALLVSVLMIGIGLILLGFVLCEIGKCRRTWREFRRTFRFHAPLTPEGREGIEAMVREVLSRMVADLKIRFAEQEMLAADLKASDIAGCVEEEALLALTEEIAECKKAFHQAVDTATSGWLPCPYSYQRFTHRYEDYAVAESAAEAR